MVEEERLAEHTPEPAQKPIGLRWIAGMENVEAAPEEGEAKRKQRSQQKAPDKFRREAELARRVEGQGIAEDFDPFEHLVARFEAFRLRTNDADVIAGLGQGRRLEPHAAIKGHGEVLHDDQYASSAHAVSPIIDTGDRLISLPVVTQYTRSFARSVEEISSGPAFAQSPDAGSRFLLQSPAVWFL